MVEADLTYFWQMPRIDARIHCASTPKSSRTLSELGLDCGHKVSASIFSQHSGFRQNQIKTNHANMGIFLFMLAFFVFWKRNLIISTSRIGIVDFLRFPLNCQ